MRGLRCSSQDLYCGMQASYLWHLTLGCSVHAVLVLWLGIEPWTIWIGGMESYPLDNQGSPYSFYCLLSTRHSAGSEDTMGSNKKDSLYLQGLYRLRKATSSKKTGSGAPRVSQGRVHTSLLQQMKWGVPLFIESACNAGDLGSIPGLGRSPVEGKGYRLQYSGLENSMDYTVHGVANSRTRLSDFHFFFWGNVSGFLNLLVIFFFFLLFMGFSSKDIGMGYHFFLQKVRWLDSIINSMDMNWSKLQETVEDRGVWCAADHGVTKSQTWLSDWTTTHSLPSSQSYSEVGNSHPPQYSCKENPWQATVHGVVKSWTLLSMHTHVILLPLFWS